MVRILSRAPRVPPRQSSTSSRSMCSDLVYCILFPQLLMVVHFKHHCNTYGSLAAYIMAFFLRLSGGEPLLGLPPLIEYPGYNGEKQLFPFRTLAMVSSLATLVGVSWFTKYVFRHPSLPSLLRHHSLTGASLHPGISLRAESWHRDTTSSAASLTSQTTCCGSMSRSRVNCP